MTAEELIKDKVKNCTNTNTIFDTRDYVLKSDAIQAMEQYSSQDRWVKVDKDKLPTVEVLALNSYNVYNIGTLEKCSDGTIICYNKQLTMYDVTHYEILTAPKKLPKATKEDEDLGIIDKLIGPKD
jgi:vacuolar-type H+-ATPase subunit E/Vma4